MAVMNFISGAHSRPDKSRLGSERAIWDVGMLPCTVARLQCVGLGLNEPTPTCTMLCLLLYGYNNTINRDEKRRDTGGRSSTA